MNYETLLYAAKKNEVTRKEPIRCLQTKFKPPTREQREKEKVLSEGVAKFLARKDEEEKKKKQEASKKKEELMALRAKDPKANKRIQTMLKRTKSANKSVMEDAIDNDNTADTLGGPLQPDDDDYGFTSEAASEGYQKLMQKLYSKPSDELNFAPSRKPKSVNLLSTKERVKMALIKEKEDELLPKKRKRKHKDSKTEEDDQELDFSAPDRDMKSERREKEEKPKPRRPAPPPLDFNELLKIAEKKQYEPIVVEKKPVEKEPEILMTKKQKAEYEKLQEIKRRRLQRDTARETSDDRKLPKIPKLGSNEPLNKDVDSLKFKKIPKIDLEPKSKLTDTGQKLKPIDKPRPKVEERDKRTTEKQKEKKNDLESETDLDIERLKRECDEVKKALKEKEQQLKEKNELIRRQKEKERIIRERDEAIRKLKMYEEEEKLLQNEAKKVNKFGLQSEKKLPNLETQKNKIEFKNQKEMKPREQLTKSMIPKNSVREFPPRDIKPKEFPPRDMKPKQFPPKDLQNRPGGSSELLRSKKFPPADVKRKILPMNKKRQILDDSEEEYDSELDDFIDDGPDDIGKDEVSKVISEVFKYDKNKYSRYEDDDECMESNFAQISKEEFISTKCGLLEDLEDIRREKQAIARKKIRTKKT